MRNNLQKIKTALRKTNFQTFGFFLFFSALVWVLLQLSKEYTQVIEIPLTYVNAPMDKSISTEKPTAVEARLQDKGFGILYYQWFKPSLEVDLEQTREEGDLLVYSLAENQEEVAEQLDLNLEKTRFLVDEILIGFQPRKKKKLKVEPRINLNFAVGYSTEKQIELSPDSVEVAGPENIVDTLKQIRTLPLKINNISSDIRGRIGIDTSGLAMLSFYRNRVNYVLEVEKFTEGQVKVEVEVLNVPEGVNLSIFPREVVVYYQVNLERYELVKETDFSVVCDYNTMGPGDDYLIAEIADKPDFIHNLRLSERKIQFVIKR